MKKKRGFVIVMRCRGKIALHNDGQAFLCMSCGKKWQRTRNQPYPDTTHEKQPYRCR